MPLRLNHTTTIICSSVFKIKQVYGDKITVFPGTEWYVLSRNNNKESRHIPSVILTRQETDCPHIPFWNPIELMHATVNLSGKHGNNSHGQGLSHWHFWSWINKPRHVHFHYQFNRDKLNQATRAMDHFRGGMDTRPIPTPRLLTTTTFTHSKTQTSRHRHNLMWIWEGPTSGSVSLQWYWEHANTR